MLLVDKNEHGVRIEIKGGGSHILAELGILVATVQESVGTSLNVYEALNNPIQKCLTQAYMKAMRENSGQTKEPERKADSTEN